MRRYKIPNTLTRIDTAYIAGLVDGEGTITLTRKHRHENRQLAVTISNTEKPLLDFVLATVGAGKITRKRVSQAHHTPSFTCAIYNQQALNLLEPSYVWWRLEISGISALGKVSVFFLYLLVPKVIFFINFSLRISSERQGHAPPRPKRCHGIWPAS